MAGRSTKQANLSPRGEAARAKLKDAARRTLENLTCHQVRIADVTGEAGVATGLFYRYFDDLNELFHELVEEFIEQFVATDEIEAGVRRGDWFGRIHAHTRFVVRAYSASPGMMRCVFDLAAADPAVRNRWRTVQQRRLHQLVALMPRIFPQGGMTDAHNELVVSALGSIGEGFLRDYFINRNDASSRFEYSEAELSEWLATLFYRGLFGNDPPVERLRYSTAVTSLHR